jgi:hypothetical protein
MFADTKAVNDWKKPGGLAPLAEVKVIGTALPPPTP